MTSRRVASAIAWTMSLSACAQDRRAPVEQVLLERRIQGLESLAALAEAGPIVPFDQILVVVRQNLVQDLLSAAVPYEQIIGGKYRVVVDAATVRFDSGFGLVQLDGRGSFADGGDAAAYADVSLYGSLDLIELDATSGVLRGRVKILAFDANRVDVLGLSAPVTRLIEELSRERLSAFEVLLSDIEIPVRLEADLTVPEVRHGGVAIESAQIPLKASVVDVKAFHERLFVSIAASATLARSGGAGTGAGR